jgi:selenocysteine lyase/cysteine desulfurase
MTFDVQRARQETPGCEEVLHFNNAGSALPPQPVLEATVNYLQLEARLGGYETEEREQAAIEHTYDAVASLLGCAHEEVALVESATHAWQQAFYAIPFQRGERILTAMSEYSSNYIAYLQLARRLGVVVEPVPNDEHGQISLEALRQMIDERVRLIAITHVPTSGGLVNPAAEVGKIAREHGILYLLDACQSIGQLPLNVESIGCDLLSATGRKYLRAPRGTGFLYVRQAILERLEPPTLDMFSATWTARDSYEMRPDARRFEHFESNLAGRVGLGVAIDYALQWGIEAIWRRVRDLAYALRTRLSSLPGVIVHDRGIVQCGIVTFTLEGQDPVALKKALARQQMHVTVAVRSSTRLDLEERDLTSMVRASVHYYNTLEEIERFCQAIEVIAAI